ncbi:hypothetical protein SCLCIDRAFT_11928 [Scleroderma citrinum Foug A]|uniref:Uncharacterized protein n=1 Tax=Scleroderma citrinum Foug A TaxID=1036808 RepID=A0A0C2YRB8_9AGAM|nr:hypothetical protein SCLCIDRAFT_11928 [Scleroderma citrinum Foug A]
MSSDNINPAAVTTPVRTITINNTSVVDIHSLSSEWNTYLVRFTPTNPGPVAPPSQPCTPADLKIFNPPKVSPEKPKRVILETRQALGREAETSHVWKLSQIDTNENTAEQDIKRPHTDT